MKRAIAATVVLAVIIGFASLHVYKTLKLTGQIEDLCGKVEENYKNENWEEIRKAMNDIDNIWEKSHKWAYITLDTDQIDEIEISLKQSMAYAEIEDGEDFIGEFVMFHMLMDHLPKQETFSIGELF